MPTNTSTAAHSKLPGWPDLDATGLASATLDAMIERHERATQPRLRTLWAYYRNHIEHLGAGSTHGAPASRAYRLAQERGLPPRITGGRSAAALAAGALPADNRPWARKEVVIENDIAWRIHTMVDFMFGRTISLRSQARDPELRRTIERVLEGVWESSGGIGLLQDLGLLGNVYGHADLVVRASSGGDVHEDAVTVATAGADATAASAARFIAAAQQAVRIELVEPTRGMARLNSADYRLVDAYILRYEREEDASESSTAAGESSAPSGPMPASVFGRLLNSVRASVPISGGRASSARSASPRTTITEIIGPRERRVYATDSRGRTRLISSGPSLIDPARSRSTAAQTGDTVEPPVVHIQNMSQPFAFAGLSEVEPLIPLQDELNTRLSDRASRVTMSSFRMYLAKGLDSADRLPVAPGTIWSTDNPEAQVISFGGDTGTPSEDRHIDEIREAMDKQSGVPPLAAGVVRAKVGNLSSQTALRLTLSGLLSKTARKRVTYGRGIARACELVLEALDALNILNTDPLDRTLSVQWPEPLPRDEQDVLDAAQKKLGLGIPRDRVLAELGYAPEQPGEV